MKLAMPINKICSVKFRLIYLENYLRIKMKLLQFILYSAFIVYVSSDRIQDGKEVYNDKFPFFVTLYLKFSSSTHGDWTDCGGSLIHPQWVLTAGHCFPQRYEDVKAMEHMDYWKMVRIGGESQSILAIRRHPKYRNEDGRITYDIALIQVKKPFGLTKLRQVIRLSTSKPPCEYVIAIGKGRTHPDNTQLSPVVKYAVLKITNYHGGLNSFIANPAENGTHEAAGKPLVGDSGGPFICDGVSPPLQVGVFSGWAGDFQGDSIRVEDVEHYIGFISKWLPSDNYTKYLDEETKPKEKQRENSNPRISFSLILSLYLVILCAYIV